ncbi:M1 family aminopeptidase [Botrimarina mediterranea]|uniref:Aminopeptidase N n=1 Tax=Botrimarina mediterranea TaxID=2528022 RepID=A0A518K6D2_9BACT|nr:M1 family aminopeptidase [Botrimarina mediterranea]QDV73338.1 Aminopeptidase N [Botrimarina mediterranea]
MRSVVTRCALVVALVLAASYGFAEHVCRYCQADAAAEAAKHGPHYAPDRVVDVKHIEIDVTPDFAAKTIHATTTLEFAPIAKPARLVTLNAVGLRVEKIDASRKLAEHSSTGEHLKLLFEEPIPVGETVKVAITYTAEPKKGLYFRTEDMGYPKGEDHIWTQGETHEAPHWFPCFDYPNERSTTEVICRVPEEMTALSNGKLIDETVDEATGLKAVHWRQGKPHVNYLVCLCAGHFAKLEKEASGVRLGFYTQPSFIDEAPNSFQDTAAILEFFQEEIGVPYPWDKYDQVTILDYNWGGMENTTLTTLTHETVYSDATENVRSSQGLDAHEFAHQWFGDYVTCKDWSHIWLNEGFATYYTHLYAGHKDGRDALLYGLWRDATGSVLPAIIKNGDTKPIVYRNYAEAFDQFDYRAYPKGSWVLHMLRSRLGEDLYREAIKKYLERHALSSVVTDDLRQALEEVSGQPLDAFFDQWVYHGGAPKLEVSHDWKPEEKLLRVTVKQGEPIEGKTMLFTFPVMLRAHVGDEVVDHEVEITKTEQDFYFKLDAQPDVVRFDPQFTVLAEVKHEKSEEMLEKQLQLADDMIGRLLAAEALGEKDSKAATKALAAALGEDKFYGVRIAASKALGEQGTDDALDALLAGREQSDARIRLQVVEDIGKFFDTKAYEVLNAVVANEKNPDIVAAALSGLAKYPEAAAGEAIAKALDSESFQNQLAIAAARALGKRRDPALAESLVKALRDRRFELPGRRYGEVLVGVGRVGRELEDKTIVREFLAELLQDPVIAVRLGAIEGLGELGDKRAKPLLGDLAATSGKEATTAKKALQRLNAAPSDPPEAVEDLREQLDKLRDEQKELKKQVEQLQAT